MVALGFDPGIEITTTDSFGRLGRGTKPNNRISGFNPTYNRNKSSAISEQGRTASGSAFLGVDKAGALIF